MRKITASVESLDGKGWEQCFMVEKSITAQKEIEYLLECYNENRIDKIRLVSIDNIDIGYENGASDYTVEELESIISKEIDIVGYDGVHSFIEVDGDYYECKECKLKGSRTELSLKINCMDKLKKINFCIYT